MGKKNEARQAAKNDSKMTPEREAQLLAPWLIKELRCPCLVQILEERPDTDNPRKGIDRYFTMHYMEFGALPQTLRRMRAVLDNIQLMQMPLPDGRMFWYVGVEASWGYARLYLESCLDPSVRTIKVQMMGTPKCPAGPRYKLAGDRLTSHEVGWWVVSRRVRRDADSDRGSELRATDWAMFDDEKHAKNFLAGLWSRCTSRTR